MESPEILPKLLRAYDTLPRHEGLLEGVRAGKLNFLKELQRSGLSRQAFDTSQVHAPEDIGPQAVICALPYEGKPTEVAEVSCLVYGCHFLDDFFDRPDRQPNLQTMSRYRGDIKGLLDRVGNVGRFAHHLAQRSRHPDLAYKGLQRLVYGALIQLARTPKEQDTFLHEHKELVLRDASQEVRRDASRIGPIPYWMTTKTIMECMITASEVKANQTLPLLWDLAYAPALYWHDAQEEEAKGELNFFQKPKPTVAEMQEMIEIAAKHLPLYENREGSGRYRQLQLLRQVFSPVLPERVSRAYEALERRLKAHVELERDVAGTAQ